MRIIIHAHAREHGLSDEQITCAYETGYTSAVTRKRDWHGEPPRWAMIGFDRQAREIKLAFVQLNGQTVLIFHANYATKGFKREMEEARR
ncbi:hypothetical protein KIM372_14010 [Bombiscardovia nodaiensis]|uniref:DUF4258 domain-containing protein n=1 Tax=Bombiscardovia nodaiensis TaxID=2932181 RepID=A0ABN6SBK6_9BIFI|nr:hypothetical protein KIM372_14010 [Bombiscardovia nodaiensis]